MRRIVLADNHGNLLALEAARSNRSARVRHLNGRRVLNPGGVGCPASHDDTTVPPHVSETGCPSARYAILDATRAAPMIEPLSIPSPHEEVPRGAEATRHPDWAHALWTGVIPREAA